MVLCMYLKAQTGHKKFFICIQNHEAFVEVGMGAASKTNVSIWEIPVILLFFIILCLGFFYWFLWWASGNFSSDSRTPLPLFGILFRLEETPSPAFLKNAGLKDLISEPSDNRVL